MLQSVLLHDMLAQLPLTVHSVAHLGFEHFRVKRLRNVVIGPAVESFHGVFAPCFGRKQDDRNMRCRHRSLDFAT